jgi:hypothetical protein
MPKDLFEGKDNAIIAARLTEKSEIPNVLDNKEVFLYACALRQPPRAVRKPPWRTRSKKLPYYRVDSVVVGKIAAGVGIWGGRKSRGGILGKKGKMEKIWRGIDARFCGSEFPSLVVGRRGAGWTDDVAPRNLQRLSSGQFFVKSLEQTFSFSCEMLSQDTDNLKVRLHC